MRKLVLMLSCLALLGGGYAWAGATGGGERSNTAKVGVPSVPIVVPIDSALVISGPLNRTTGNRPNGLWIRWALGSCAAGISEGRFHSAEFAQTPEGIVVTLRVHRAVQDESNLDYDPYDTARRMCTEMPRYDFHVAPMPAAKGQRKLLDGWCSRPVECPVVEGYAPIAKRDVESLVVRPG